MEELKKNLITRISTLEKEVEDLRAQLAKQKEVAMKEIMELLENIDSLVTESFQKAIH